MKSAMPYFYYKISTYLKLGIPNLLRVGIYRLLIKFGIHPVQRLRFRTIYGPFYQSHAARLEIDPRLLYPYDEVMNGYWPFSGRYIFFDSQKPDWHRNYFNGNVSGYSEIPWWNIPDFDEELGDIKTVWELSRFDWVIHLASWSALGKKEALVSLNDRLNDWMRANPPYVGPNWKCGQEASIRILHLVSAAMVMRLHENPSKSLLDLIELHLLRIEHTIGYAIGQNNNHGISEAAALFVGGHFLVANGRQQFNGFSSKGRRWLEDRARKLIDEDGCFSQYSVNYHRLVLDIYSFCETYRRSRRLPDFSVKLNEKLIKAMRWLGLLTDEFTGDAPNLGANDGSRLFQFIFTDYRDYRISVQWSSILFCGKPWFELSAEVCSFFDLMGIAYHRDGPTLRMKYGRIEGNHSGIFIQRTSKILFVFRRPVFRFRPIQSDVLNIDLWVDGENILRDGGSYNYHGSAGKMQYYSGSSSHNTVVIDDTDPMPKISRFLFGKWLNENSFNLCKLDDSIEITSGFTDYLHRTHQRSIVLNDFSLSVTDSLEGVSDKAVLSWRLPPFMWKLEKFEKRDSAKLHIDIVKRIVIGCADIECEYESRHFLEETAIPVVKYGLKGSGVMETIITWS